MTRQVITALIAFWLTACTATPHNSASSDTAATKARWPHGAMVTAANPHAVEAAADVLAAGGHAVDAAIAAHAVLGLVEPQSSGLGGGAFMLVYDYASGKTTVYDGRETAPSGVTPELFIRDGEALGFIEAWQSGLSVGVPGTVALYESAHANHGRQPWADLFAAGIKLAEDGFAVSPRLNNLLGRVARFSLLDDNPDTAAYFYPDGEPLPVGFIRKNPDYANTLRRIAAEGASVMHTGEIAEAIAAAVRAEPRGGSMTVSDIENYKVRIREPVCGEFRDYTICSAPPPSSGVAQITIAALYDRLVADDDSIDNKLQAFVDAQRLAYADRDHYIADPDFATVPTDDLHASQYLDHRAQQRFAPGDSAVHGDPGEVLRDIPLAALYADDSTDGAPGTSHVSVIDIYGNAVSLTASVEAPFGSSRWVGGFLLNNELTDFAREPVTDGKLAANAAAPGKRPRSSMSPTLIFDADGSLKMVTGSPGGNSIVGYVAKSTLGVLAWDMSVQEAIDYPNIVARGDRIRVETAEAEGQRVADMLKNRGYDVQERRGENSGLHTILVHENALEGGADPRREGIVRSFKPATGP